MKLRRAYTYPLICLLILTSQNLNGTALHDATGSDEQVPIQSPQVQKSFEQERIEDIYSRYKSAITLDALKEVWCMFFTFTLQNKNSLSKISKIIETWSTGSNKQKSFHGKAFTFQELLQYWYKNINNEQQICHSICPI